MKLTHDRHNTAHSPEAAKPTFREHMLEGAKKNLLKYIAAYSIFMPAAQQSQNWADIKNYTLSFTIQNQQLQVIRYPQTH